MPIIGWIRDLFGIQKDMYETKKTRLEIEKIEDEKREKLIRPATMDDVKKYDPSYKELVHQISRRNPRGMESIPHLQAAIEFLYIHKRKTFWLIVIAIVALLVWLFSR